MRKFSYMRACLVLMVLTTVHIHAMQETLELSTAARKNLIPELLQLLKTPGSDVNKPGPEGFTALHWAARNGHLEVVAILLAYNADPTITTPQGKTAMQLAQEKSHNAIVSILLKHHQQNQSIPAALILEEGYFDIEPQPVKVTLKREIKNGDQARARKDKNLINQSKRKGDTQLHKAIRAQRTDVVRDLLQRGAHIDARGKLDQTPLRAALEVDCVELVELLIAYGANIELSHPLHWAAVRNRIASVKILIRAGADLQAKASYGGRLQCVLELVRSANRGGQDNRLAAMEQFLVDQGADCSNPTKVHVFLHFKEAKGIVLKAVTEHHKATVEQVLQYDGTDKEEIERRDEYGQTPLLLAAECCMEGIALMLITFKANVTAQDDEGGTALHYAASEGNQTRLIEALIKAEANVNAQNTHGETALHMSAQRKVVDDKKVAKERLKVAKLLLKKADQLVDEQGKTALHHAVEANNFPLVKLLAKTTPSVPDHQGQTPLLLATSRGYHDLAKLLGKKK